MNERLTDGQMSTDDRRAIAEAEEVAAAALQELAIIRDENADLRRQLDDAGKAAFVAHMEERNRREAAEAKVAALETICPVCGKQDISTAEDGGPECQMATGHWVCSRRCYELLAEARAATDAAGALNSPGSGAIPDPS